MQRILNEEQLKLIRTPISKITHQIYIGNILNACNLNELQHLKITYILNIGKNIPCFYQDTKQFIYKQIEIDDVPQADISQYFDECYSFIQNAIKNNGIILIHCYAGISRSATILIMYLMKRHQIFLSKAFEIVKQRRSIINPNEGFLSQLEMFELKQVASIHKYQIGQNNQIIEYLNKQRK